MYIDTDVKINVGPDDEEVTLYVRGRFSSYGSYNPNERGMSLNDWDITGTYNDAGDPIVTPMLTNSDREHIEQKLYDAR